MKFLAALLLLYSAALAAPDAAASEDVIESRLGSSTLLRQALGGDRFGWTFRCRRENDDDVCKGRTSRILANLTIAARDDQITGVGFGFEMHEGDRAPTADTIDRLLEVVLVDWPAAKQWVSKKLPTLKVRERASVNGRGRVVVPSAEFSWEMRLSRTGERAYFLLVERD